MNKLLRNLNHSRHMRIQILLGLVMLAITSTITAQASVVAIDYSTFSTFLASDYSGAAAVSGVAGLMLIVTILLIIYSVISFLLPIFVYRIMRRGTASYHRLEEIRDVLRKQALSSNQPEVQLETQPIFSPPAPETVNIFSGEIVK